MLLLPPTGVPKVLAHAQHELFAALTSSGGSDTSGGGAGGGAGADASSGAGGRAALKYKLRHGKWPGACGCSGGHIQPPSPAAATGDDNHISASPGCAAEEAAFRAFIARRRVNLNIRQVLEEGQKLPE